MVSLVLASIRAWGWGVCISLLDILVGVCAWVFLRIRKKSVHTLCDPLPDPLPKSACRATCDAMQTASCNEQSGSLLLPWRKAGPPNHHDDKVDSDQ